MHRWAFDSSGNNYRAWMFMAETLLEAAKNVKKGAADEGGEELHDSGLMLDTDSVYAMLLGYTIECLLKGIWVKNGNVLAKNGSLVPIPGTGDHQRAQLA
jgi:hypothetical protein